MSDFKIQYIAGTIASGSSSKTLTSPADFQQVVFSSTFILPATTMPTVGVGIVGGSTQMRNYCIDADLFSTGDQITLLRGNTTGLCEYAFWLVEYIGAPGGPNEFIMRDEVIGVLPAGLTSQDSDPISGIASINRCIPFISGRYDNTSSAALRDFMAEARIYNNAGNNVIGLTRGLAGDEARFVCYVVEFTGSNWSLSTGSVTGYSPNVDKVTNIGAVPAVNKALVFGYYMPGNRDTPAGATHFAWLSSPVTLRTRTIEVSTLSVFRYYVLANSDQSFSVQTINALNGVSDWLAGASPQTQALPIAPTNSAGVFVTGFAGSNATSSTNNPASNWRFSQFAPDEIQAFRTRADGDTEYIVQIVSLPVDQEISTFISPARGVVTLFGRTVNSPVFISPGMALFALVGLPQPSQVARTPAPAALSMQGRQPQPLAIYPVTGSLSMQGRAQVFASSKTVTPPVPALNYTPAQETPPTILFIETKTPGTLVMVLEPLEHNTTEGGNIEFRSPITATLALVGQQPEFVVNDTDVGLIIIEGRAPTIEATRLTIEPEAGLLQLSSEQINPVFVHIPYQWIDVDPGQVVNWV